MIRIGSAVAAMLLLLPACEARIGARADETAAKTVEEDAGAFSLKAPGIDMKVDLPKSVTDRAVIQGGNDILYPGARLAGLSIDAAGETKDQVVLRFASADPLPRIVGWYRDGARASEFLIGSAARDGDGMRIAGTKADGQAFTLQLAPDAGGGTKGTLVLADRP